MDSKNIKVNLKLAKEALKNKDFKETLRHCKEVIKCDKNNYTATVFIGVAAQELQQNEQALIAFKRGISNCPDQILAWQGLCTFYEKVQNEDHKKDLVEVYRNLLTHYDSDIDRYFTTAVKLVNLLSETNEIQQVIDFIQALQIRFNSDCQKFYKVNEILVQILNKNENFKSQYQQLMLQSYDCLTHPDIDVEDTSVEAYCVDYFTFLFEVVQDYRKAELTAREMLSKYKSTKSTHMLIKFYVHQYCVNDKPLPGDFVKLLEDSEKGDDGEVNLNHVAKSALLWNQKNYEKALKQLDEVDFKSPEFYYIATICYQQIHQYEKCQKLAYKGIAICGNQQKYLALIRKLKILIIKCIICGQENFKDAISLLNEFEQRNEDVLVLYARVYIKMNMTEDAEKICYQLSNFDSLDSLTVQAELKFVQEDYQSACNLLLECLKSEDQECDVHLLFGHVLWKQNKFSESFQHFLQAAKLDPYRSDCFLWLGHYYKNHTQIIQRTEKCYQKAFELNISSDEAGCAYSDILTELGKEEENYEVLCKATNVAKAGRMKWAFLRLGLHHLKHGNLDKAVLLLQNAIRADPSDSHCWECLADSYMLRGSYTAALKAFIKASEISKQPIYSMYQVGNLKEKLGHYSEAIDQFKRVLDIDPQYIPAMKSLASSLLHLANSYLKMSFNKLAVRKCQEALNHLSSALNLRPNLVSLWKLAGDACTLTSRLSPDIVRLSIPFGPFSESAIKSDESTLLNREKLLNLGSRCYGRALCLSPKSSSLWHDIGVNYLYQAINEKDSSMRNNLHRRSMLSLQKSLSLDPSSHRAWNSLGVAAASAESKYNSIAQHSFIQSVKLESNNVIAWTNLGVLYLLANNIDLAHRVLSVAQAIEPSSAGCWIAQALIAERIGHEETMDLFRHSVELSSHPEAGLGYANWVCQTLLETTDHSCRKYKYDLEQLSAVTVASDALVNYTDSITDNSVAFNMLGILLERQNLFKSAASSYKKALDVLHDDSEDSIKCGLMSNYARALYFGGCYSESVQVYRCIESDQLQHLLYKAEALYRNQDFVDALHTYEKAKKYLDSSVEEWTIDVALAMAAYKMGHINQSKTLLLTSSQKNKNSVESRLALCALGILTSDTVLTNAAVHEIIPFQDVRKYIKDVALFQSYVAVMRGDKRKAIVIICGTVHKYPEMAELWLLLASTLLQLAPEKATIASYCASVALKSGNNSQQCYLLLCLSHLIAGHVKLSTKVAQQALHKFPDDSKLWLCLCAAMTAGCIYASKSCNCRFVDRLLAVISCKELANPWILTYRAFVLLHLENWKLCDAILEQIPDDDDMKPMLKSLARFLQCKDDESLHELTATVVASSSLYRWMVLFNCFKLEGKMEESELLLKRCIQTAGTVIRPERKKIIPLLSLALLYNYQSGDEFRMRQHEVLSQVRKIDPSCKVLHFIEAMLSRHNKRDRLVKKKFGSVIHEAGIETLNVEMLACRIILKDIDLKKDDVLFKKIVDVAVKAKDEELKALCDVLRKDQ